jgi:hypothetical protein
MKRLRPPETLVLKPRKIDAGFTAHTGIKLGQQGGAPADRTPRLCGGAETESVTRRRQVHDTAYRSTVLGGSAAGVSQVARVLYPPAGISTTQ